MATCLWLAVSAAFGVFVRFEVAYFWFVIFSHISGFYLLVLV